MKKEYTHIDIAEMKQNHCQHEETELDETTGYIECLECGYRTKHLYD